MSGTNPLDYNSAELQSTAFDLLPNGTMAKVRLTIRPGGTGPEGWITQSRTSTAQYLNTEAVILEGAHARRRIYTRIGLRGKGGQGADDSYANRGRALIRAILESARGVQAADASDRARAARTIRSFAELNGIEFIARIGIDKDKSDPTAQGRNVIAAAIGPDHAEYQRLMGAPPQPALPVVSAMPVPSGGGANSAAWPAQQAAPTAGGNADAPFWAR
jgi:hypothetical protein